MVLMAKTEAEQGIRDLKKAKVREIIVRICKTKSLSWDDDRDFINFKNCWHEEKEPYQLGHCHLPPDRSKICISESQLDLHKTDKALEHTVYHEMTHLLNPSLNHGSEFERRINELKKETDSYAFGASHTGSLKPISGFERVIKNPGKGHFNIIPADYVRMKDAEVREEERRAREQLEVETRVVMPVANAMAKAKIERSRSNVARQAGPKKTRVQRNGKSAKPNKPNTHKTVTREDVEELQNRIFRNQLKHSAEDKRPGKKHNEKEIVRSVDSKKSESMEEIRTRLGIGTEYKSQIKQRRKKGIIERLKDILGF